MQPQSRLRPSAGAGPVPFYLTNEQGAALTYAREVLIATRGAQPGEHREAMDRCQCALRAVLSAFSATFRAGAS